MMDRLDHGFLNIPLTKRGNIDAQIDRYKAQQARARIAADTARYHGVREKQSLVKQMVANLSDERVMEMAKPLGCRKPSTARAAICQAARSNLDRFINVLWKEFHNCGNCASWKGGECWSPDRLDDPSRGSAGATYAHNTCEAWREKSA